MSSTLVRLQAIGMLTLEPERLKNQLATTRQRSPEMERDHNHDLKGLFKAAATRASVQPGPFQDFYQA